MGGCRCSYRSCTAKSDGKIHMFHYPVFDKIRCHQWLTNARKLEFLDLKVSQLKNRVVCQHHFLPLNFMNFRMDKLKFDAVPTENGPYCDPDEDDDMSTVSKTTIDPEEIDVEPLSTKDKVASLKVKFAEFLCNSDLEVEPNKEGQSLVIKDVKGNFGIKDENTFKFPYRVSRSSGEEVKKQQPQPMLVVPPFSDSTHQIFVHNTRSNVQDMVSERNPRSLLKTDSSKKVKIISEKKITSPVPVKGKLEPVSPSLIIKPRGKPNDFIPIIQNTINIEGDKLLQDNLLLYENTSGLTQNAEQVPFDTQLLEAQANRCTFVVSPIDKKFESRSCKPSQFVDSQTQAMSVMNEEINNTSLNERILLQLEDFNNYTQNKKPSIPTSPNVSQLKGKIPPERIAAIEEKRNFNKKLRDMIEFCLDELDCPEKPNENSLEKKIINRQPIVKVEKGQIEPEKLIKVSESELQQKNAPLKTKQHNQAYSQDRVASHVSMEKSLPSTGEYAMAALEERLNKMEETLLCKIDQNSQRILDLKSTIETTSTIATKRASVICQTKDDMDTYKRQLFKEISQFLGPQAKSLIYEEMFLNKFTKVSTNTNVEEKDESIEVDMECASPKRRRRRRRL